MDDINKVKEFWETCSPTFANIKRSTSEQRLFDKWDEQFLDQLGHYTDFESVMDYGIGSAYLAKHLEENYNLKKYIGIDISKRQLRCAKVILKDMDDIQCELHLTPYNFSQSDVDVFISIAVIQYFPSLLYLNQFLTNINYSHIPLVCLQIRYGTDTLVNHKSYDDIRKIHKNCYTNSEYIQSYLNNYDVVWESDVIKVSNSQHLIFAIK